MRGKLLHNVPTARGNPYATACVDAAVSALPAADRDELLARWRTLREPAASRAVHRVLRYGALRPAAPHDAAQARRFVTAGLAQVLLDTLYSSWSAWHPRLAANVAKLPDAQVETLADALSVPRELAANALGHAVLRVAGAAGGVDYGDAQLLREARAVRRSA